jgi:AAA15 family ATPase/GTPase
MASFACHGTHLPMLIQFSVENFLSFDEEQIFSMVASTGDQHPTHLVSDIPRKSDSLLRAAALYGANGAGKSNLVQAIRFAKNLITEGTRGTQTIPVRPFKLGSEVSRPSKFEFVIRTQGVLYNYGFRLEASRILEEWLYATPNKQEVKFFERVTSSEGKAEVPIRPALSGRSGRQKQFLEFVAQGTRPNQLFLTQAIENNVSELKPLFDWFEYTCLILSAEATSRDVEGRAHAYPDFTSFLSRFLCAADTGIENVTTEEIPFDFERFVPEMPNAQREEIRAIIAGMPKGFMTTIRSLDGERYALKSNDQGEPMLIQFKMQHRGKEGQKVPFEIYEESEGTQRLIHLLPALYSFQEDAERVVIVDELDRRLHPLVARLVVQAAMAGGKNNQLIFTTHDTNLLDLDLLRRDEIWFIEKDKSGASHLYSLAEFKTRPDLKIEKGYLNGRFGAIPFIGDIERLQESAPGEPALEPEMAGTAA